MRYLSFEQTFNKGGFFVLGLISQVQNSTRKGDFSARKRHLFHSKITALYIKVVIGKFYRRAVRLERIDLGHAANGYFVLFVM